MNAKSHRDRNPAFWREKGDVPLWRIAEKLQIHEVTLTRWLRVKVDDKKMQRILKALEQVKQELN